MPELPSHHDTGPAVENTPIAAGRSRRRKVLIAVVVVALVALAAVLHLTGVLGGEGH
jgi:4-hydroxybenzoate polyprenyltransferase